MCGHLKVREAALDLLPVRFDKHDLLRVVSVIRMLDQVHLADGTFPLQSCRQVGE
jgi:hypothetical protein